MPRGVVGPPHVCHGGDVLVFVLVLVLDARIIPLDVFDCHISSRSLPCSHSDAEGPYAPSLSARAKVRGSLLTFKHPRGAGGGARLWGTLSIAAGAVGGGSLARSAAASLDQLFGPGHPSPRLGRDLGQDWTEAVNRSWTVRRLDNMCVACAW